MKFQKKQDKSINNKLPIEWISFRVRPYLSFDINIKNLNTQRLFNWRTFNYKNPTKRYNQIYLINSNYSCFRFQIFYRIYDEKLIPIVGSQNFNKTMTVGLYSHSDDETGLIQTLNEHIFFMDDLTTDNSSSSATFIRNMKLNDRIRFVHINGERDIKSEILISVEALW